MAGSLKQSSRNRKIEPLNWAETANSPALKGMMSFLDITSEEVRSGHFKDVPREVVKRTEVPDADPVQAASEVLSLPASPHPQAVIEIRSRPQKQSPADTQEDTLDSLRPPDRGETHTGSDTQTAAMSETRVRNYLHNVQAVETQIGSDTPTGAISEVRTTEYLRSVPLNEIRRGSDTRGGSQSETRIGSDTRGAPVSGTRIGSKALSGLESQLPALEDEHSPHETPTGSAPFPVSVSLAASRVVLGSVPSQNRKIRKCRLSQDGHSAGEEMLYRILWEEGRPETANLLGSRLVRIGYAELANKARLHKANVRLNLASLTAKLAIEQNGDFNSREMIAKAYRVFSYKEILERRRAAGLEFVIRQKNVVFVTESGQPVPLAGLPPKGSAKTIVGVGPSAIASSPVSDSLTLRASSPASEAPPKSGPLAVREAPPVSDTLPVGDTLPVSDTLPASDTLPESDTHTGNDAAPGSPYEADLACVSKALNTFWTVDDIAAEQLLRSCRKIRPDAEAQEIAFFVIEKLQVTRTNRQINNPVGLILATVPQSFSGHSFEIFRQRRQESVRLAEEEAVRKAEEDRMMNEWVIKDATKTLANPSSSEEQRQHAQETIASLSGLKK